MSKIFISYRRSDSSDVTGRIFDRLADNFGKDNVFKDVDSIPYGVDFRKVIQDAVSKCSVLLAVIGDDWLSEGNEDGSRRIDNEEDYVVIEVLAALNRGIPVIPVLVEGATIPGVNDLPAKLKPLAFRSAARVRPDPDFRNDIVRLCAEIRKHGVSSGRKVESLWKVGIVSLTVLALAGVFLGVTRFIEDYLEDPAIDGPEVSEQVEDAGMLAPYTIDAGIEGATRSSSRGLDRITEESGLEWDVGEGEECHDITIRDASIIPPSVRIETICE